MDTQPLSKIVTLTASQRRLLQHGKYSVYSTAGRPTEPFLGQISTVKDLLVLSVQDLAKRCRITYPDAQNIVDTVCEDLASQLPLRTLDDPESCRDQTFTTGDRLLDEALGGGVRTGKLWEIVGQSAAGKSQLCMQMLLSVQLPSSLGGISGAACLLSTSWTLPTNRLLQIIDSHPNFSDSLCSLSDIHTVKTPTIPALLHVLTNEFPNLIGELEKQPFAKPVKLLIIDALTELFHSDIHVSTETLTERSRNLAEISSVLHRLAHTYNIAVIVVNEVVDVIDRGPPSGVLAHEVIYQDQARFFNRADSIPGENQREAALGLSWANQVNARIMLSRTNRRRYLEQEEVPPKRRRLNSGEPERTDADQPTLIRRLTVIFNSVAPPASLDYVVTQGGVTVLQPEALSRADAKVAESLIPSSTAAPRPSQPLQGPAGISPLDVPLARPSPEVLSDDEPQPLSSQHAVSQSSATLVTAEDGPQDEDEWDAYWRASEAEFGSDFLTELDSSDNLNNLSTDAATRNPG
ncbi:hypothetical protein NM688_g5001 [Phlebia brevispora]|uniref:Uncharacterized protein n=1 Tax=Phlebia brevispora TaxID=194682 RepID=A0ACC1T1G2_9APHY|nr:hypothetical protein NM688_g5001 [Phlebia brevispora]